LRANLDLLHGFACHWARMTIWLYSFAFLPLFDINQRAFRDEGSAVN
jgi:hypothetical protein